MMREKNFSAAMERAVQARGEGWRYPKPGTSDDDYYQNGVPTYISKSGEATCLIGAAMYEAGMVMPSRLCTSSALALLRGHVPMRVAMAARAAQIHQDCHKPWGEALRVYRAALDYCIEREHTGLPLGPWDTQKVYYEATYRAGLFERVAAVTAMASGGVITATTAQMDEFTKSMQNLAKSFSEIKITFDLPMPSSSLVSTIFPAVTKGSITISDAASVKVGQKDHALVA